MKKRLLGIVLPVLAGVAVIGTGFSTWYFTEGELSVENQSINVNLTSYARIGDLETLKTPALLYLDGDAATNGNYTDPTTGKEYTSRSDGKGIHLYESAENIGGEITADDIDLKLLTVDSNASTESVWGVTVTMKVKLTNLGGYVQIGLEGGDNSFTESNGYQTYTKTITFAALKGASGEIDMPALTFTWINEPRTKAEYNALKDAVSKASMEINYTADWVENTAD